LHVKSHYSLGYGTASITQLVERAAQMGLHALALTDLENLYGQVEFHHACRAGGVKPITGVELRPGFRGRARPGQKRGRLVLLARDRAGYASLCRIVTRRRAGLATQDHPSPDPVLSLGGDSQGQFVMTDDPDVLRRLVESESLDPACLRFLVVRPSGPDGPSPDGIRFARAHGIPLVADSDVVMLDASDRPLHELQIAIGRNAQLSAIRRTGLAETPVRRLYARSEIEGFFRDIPEALEESERIAEECALDLTHTHAVVPAIDLAAGETASSRLERLCREHLAIGRREGRWIGEAYERRLEEELGTLERLGFSSLFLVVAEVVDQASLRGIPITGRGSAVGSLTAHVLGVSDVDPVAHDLLFERLVHPLRRDLPDVDLDVCSERRDELIDWVFERFGRDRVAMVSTHGTFRASSAHREALKALGMPLREVEAFCRRLPRDDLVTGEEELMSSPGGGRLSLPALPERYRHAGPLVAGLIGLPQYLSVHPGGLVIADRSIDSYVPLERAAKGVIVTQYDARSLQQMGLAKIDLLGNRCLTEIRETLAMVGAREDDRARVLARDGLRAIPEEDPDTLATLNRADTIGCFQFETPAVRAVLAQVPIRNLDDAIAALALVRPGAASGQAKRAFVRRARGEEPPDILHPSLEGRLARTHGILLYEEDLIVVLSMLGGISLAEADELRAAIQNAQDDPATLEALRERFLALTELSGTDSLTAHAAWERVRNFVAYSFSRAHAASYALLGYRAAYLRTHFPAEFGCAVLNSHGGLYPPRTLAAAIARWGVRLRPPSVNRSQLRCTVEDPDATGRPLAIRVGLEKVKRVSRRTRARLLAGRPFRDLLELLERVPTPLRELEALVLAGACDDLPPLSAEAYPFAHEAVLEALRRGVSPGALPAHAPELHEKPSSHPAHVETYRALVRIQNELRFLEMHVSAHPMRVLRPEAARQGCLTTVEAVKRIGSFVRIAGILAAARRLWTRDRVMQFVTLEDEHGTLEAVLFPTAYRSSGEGLDNPGPFLLTGVVENDHGDVHLRVSRILPFHQREQPYSVSPAVI
jgi:DNA-directed DNA polymerase III PolC